MDARREPLKGQEISNNFITTGTNKASLLVNALWIKESGSMALTAEMNIQQ